jgi:hypothetical protein
VKLLVQRHDEGESVPGLLEPDVTATLSCDIPSFCLQRLDQALA